jgi:hypothetical protein
MDDTETHSILQGLLAAGDGAKKLNKPASAEYFYAEALRFAKANIGDKTLDSALAYYCLSMLYLEQKRLCEAAFNAHEAVNICTTFLGQGHPATGLVLHQLAEVCTAQKLHSVAHPIRKRAAEIMEEHLVTLDFSVPTKSITTLMMRGMMSVDGSWINGVNDPQELLSGEN